MKLPPLTSRALGALLILITVALYVPVISAGYIWDDDTLLTANPQMRNPHGLVEIWRGEQVRDYTPVTLSVFWLEWQLWGATPTGYHVVGILLHALCALLLWLIFRRLRVPGAWLGALLFAIHPVNVASVAWVAELKNTLSSVFFLASILTFLVARDEKRRLAYAGSLLFFLLAALSKGAVVTLPAILLLCILWRDRKVTRRDLLEILPHGLIGMAAALLTIRFQARAQHYGLIPDTLDYRVARAGAAIWDYLLALLWPAGLSPLRPQWLPNLRSPLAWLPALGALAAPGFFIWKRRSWGRPLLFAYGWFVIMLLPVLGFVWMALMQETPSADWWQYMAAPGIFAASAAGLFLLSEKSRVVLPLTALALVLLGCQTVRREVIYQSMESYCSAVTAEDPHAWTLQMNLGIMLKRRGDFAGAEACYQQALADNPRYVEARINLSNALGASGDMPGAEREMRAALRMRPGDPVILANLAHICGETGRGNEAIALQSDAVSADPSNAMNLRMLAIMLAHDHQYAKAAVCDRSAASLLPSDIGVRLDLCRILLFDGKKNDALQVCDEIDQIARSSRDPRAIDFAAKFHAQCKSAHVQSTEPFSVLEVN